MSDTPPATSANTDPSESGRPPGILPPAWLAIHLAAMVGLHWLIPGPQWIEGGVRVLGLGFIGFGVGLVLYVAIVFRQRDTTIIPLRESNALVTDGPFRWSRNPIYVGMVDVLIGTGLLLGSTTPFLAVPSFVFVIGRQWIAPEERMLEARFGDAYRAYKGQVRRWV